MLHKLNFYMQRDFWGCVTSATGKVQQKVENTEAKLRGQVKIVISVCVCVCVCVFVRNIWKKILMLGNAF